MGRIPRKDSRTMRRLDIKYLWERHKEVARLMVSGLKHVEIASKLGMSPARVAIIANSPIFEKYLDSLRGRVESGLIDVRREIDESSKEAIILLRNMLKDRAVNAQTKAKIAMDVLDRAGYGAVKTVRNENLSVVLDSNRLEELKARRSKQLEQSKMVIDAQLV